MGAGQGMGQCAAHLCCQEVLTEARLHIGEVGQPEQLTATGPVLRVEV